MHGWLLPVEDARLTILVCHGNAGNISHRLDRALRFQSELRASVLLFDYRGYGRSDGSPDEPGTYADARAAYRFLVETKRIPPQSLVIFGESLGAAVATQLALEQPVRALVLESPFTSIADMARAAYPFLPPVRGLIRTRYETLAKAGRLEMPLLVLHGERDGIVPLAQENLLAFQRTALAAGAWVRLADFALVDLGDGDGFLERGEAFEVVAELRNSGRAVSGAIDLELASSDAQVVVTSALSSAPALGAVV